MDFSGGSCVVNGVIAAAHQFHRVETENFLIRHLQEELADAKSEVVASNDLFVGAHMLALQKTIVLRTCRVLSHRVRQRQLCVCEHGFTRDITPTSFLLRIL